jgi:ABC-type nitrate/sulfonate/bicarbonate transport system ATPase subunit
MAGIIVSDVTKVYPLADGGSRIALSHVNLEVDPGEFVCLIGPSGCGKTTLLNIMSGLDRDYRGSVSFTDTPGQEPPVSGFMFQQSRLLPWLSVRDNLTYVLDDPPREARRKADRWLERIGLEGNARDYPSQLSMGMQQRVAVARSLIVEPDLLFMDEPFSSLDELTALRMRAELLELWEEQKCTVIFVTHNPLEAVFLGDRIVIMAPDPGRIQEQIDLSYLGRPRDSNATELWELSREAVSKLTLLSKD